MRRLTLACGMALLLSLYGLRAAGQFIVHDPGHTVTTVGTAVERFGQLFQQLKSMGESYKKLQGAYQELEKLNEGLQRVNSAISTGQEMASVYRHFEVIIRSTTTILTRLNEPQREEALSRGQIARYREAVEGIASRSKAALQEARNLVSSKFFRMSDAERKSMLVDLNARLQGMGQELVRLDEENARIALERHKRRHQFDFMRRY